MGVLRCVDGSVLTVVPVPCRDRTGKPYEITLELSRDDQPFARVGERCGFQLSRLAPRVADARSDPQQAAAWPDPDDRFPDPDDRFPDPDDRFPDLDPDPDPDADPDANVGAGTDAGTDAGAGAKNGTEPPGSLRDYPPAEREYFSLRARDRTDLPGSGELRCTLRASAQWLGGPGLPSATERRQRWVDGWRLTRRVVGEAWGAEGIGVRAGLTSAELVTFLDTVLSEPEARVRAEPYPAALQRAGRLLGGIRAPSWRQRGRMPDGTARARVPAIRAQARSVAFARGDAQARRSDVRR
jgi:hypothetical protein